MMNIQLQRSDVGEFRRRYRWMVLAVIAAFLVILGRLVQLQLLEYDVHRAQARRNIVREISLATRRGVLRDARGAVLASNRPSYNVYVVPGLIDMKKTWPRVMQLMGIDPAERAILEKKVLAIRDRPGDDKRKLQQLALKVDVNRDVVARLETHESELAGVDVASVPVRYYPHGALGAHVIGYMRELDQEMLTRLESLDYRSGDRIGATGVERRWESYLRGRRGWRKVIHGLKRGRDRERLEARYLDEPRRMAPVPGRDISLTIDVELEKAIDRAMRNQLAGAVVVVDVRTGRILAAYSKPSFDPDLISGGGGLEAARDAFKRLFSDPLKPMLDKTMSAAYPPGSTFKPFTSLAALDEGIINPASRVDCRGGYEYGKRYFRCTGVHRQVNLHEAIVQSCNTYFYDIGANERMQIDMLAQIGMDFGLGMKTGIGLNPEARGRMPTRSWYTRRYKDAFRGGFTLLAAIGQGAATVTVLQLAFAYAALANGGTLYQPQVVRSIETSDGTIVQEFPPRVRRVVDLNREHLAMVQSALHGAVTEKKGTAYAQAITGVDMAGKTGTAQVSHVGLRNVDPDNIWYFNRDHAWFAGYAPAENPEMAIVVLIEHGGGGGKNAVPVASRIVRDWQKLRSTRAPVSREPQRDETEEAE
ncbi:MAG: penicillin-binding protein 2 [Polyangiaceae bacterium]|nr:penicillin-binding protein 2 [Polyangiaceae bacterium]